MRGATTGDTGVVAGSVSASTYECASGSTGVLVTKSGNDAGTPRVGGTTAMAAKSAPSCEIIRAMSRLEVMPGIATVGATTTSDSAIDICMANSSSSASRSAADSPAVSGGRSNALALPEAVPAWARKVNAPKHTRNVHIALDRQCFIEQLHS